MNNIRQPKFYLFSPLIRLMHQSLIYYYFRCLNIVRKVLLSFQCGRSHLKMFPILLDGIVFSSVANMAKTGKSKSFSTRMLMLHLKTSYWMQTKLKKQFESVLAPGITKNVTQRQSSLNMLYMGICELAGWIADAAHFDYKLICSH